MNYFYKKGSQKQQGESAVEDYITHLANIFLEISVIPSSLNSRKKAMNIH